MKCNYYRASPIETYSPECQRGDSDAHPDDVSEGRFCKFCGKKIKFKEYTQPPWEEE